MCTSHISVLKHLICLNYFEIVFIVQLPKQAVPARTGNRLSVAFVMIAARVRMNINVGIRIMLMTRLADSAGTASTSCLSHPS